MVNLFDIYINSGKDELWVRIEMSACYLHQNSSWWEFQAPTSVFKVIKYLCKVKQDLQQIGIQNWSLTQPYYINKTYDMLVGQVGTKAYGME